MAGQERELAVIAKPGHRPVDLGEDVLHRGPGVVNRALTDAHREAKRRAKGPPLAPFEPVFWRGEARLALATTFAGRREGHAGCQCGHQPPEAAVVAWTTGAATLVTLRDTAGSFTVAGIEAADPLTAATAAARSPRLVSIVWKPAPVAA